MSEKHSAISLPSSRAGGNSPELDIALAEAVELFARQAFFGLVWLDRDLVALNRYGNLADFVPLGRRVTDTVAALVGLDDVLLSLKGGDEAPFQMPNIALVGPEGSSPRMDLQIFRLPERHQFLLSISKVLSAGELEVGLAQQVRKRMIAEAELAQKSRALAAANAELTRANRDLAEFAHVISHDLKAPLRAMRYCAEDLDSTLQGEGGKDAMELASQIRSHSRRMTQMLTDLLEYSKIGRHEEALEAVDTAELVRGIIASIPHPSGIVVEIAGDWPIQETYAAPLDLILRNLIGNAIAHHDRDVGRVLVTCRPGERELVLIVADDGPGIPPEWHEAIFLPFRTIAERPAADSSGIGLALVRRAAESVGAQLVLASEPARRRGVTFTMTWPLLINS